MSNGEDLSPECLQLIFEHLNEGDLKTVSLACKDFLTNSNLVKESLNVVHPNVSMLSRHLKRFTQLRKVDLSRFQGDLDEALREVARSDIGLESLNISHPDASLKTESLTELGSNPKTKKNLKALSFSCNWVSPQKKSSKALSLSCNWVSPPSDGIDLLMIGNSFPNLEELKIHGSTSPNFLTHGMEFLAPKVKLLKKIAISGQVHNVSDQSLVALSLNCIFLKDVTLDLRSCTHSVTEHGIGSLLRNRSNLEVLWVGFVKINDSSAISSTITIGNSISHAKALTSLQFFGMDISDNLLMAIGKAKLPLENFGIMYCKKFTVTGLLKVLSSNLTKLNIRGAYNFVDEDIKLLFNGNVANLTHIDIIGCQMTNSTLLSLPLAKCPSLEKITMKSRPLGLENNNGDDNVLLSKKNNIRHVQLQYFKISDELVKKFGLSFPNIKVLDLSLCNGVTSTGIEAILKSCKSIIELMLNRYGQRKMIEPDSDLPKVNLEVLGLPNSFIDDEGLAAIAQKCQGLVDLDLSCCRNVTTEGIKQMVQNIKTLTYLHVWSSEHIDYGDLLKWMLSRGNFASLKRMTLGQGRFTEEQRDQFLHHGCLLSENFKW